MSTSDLNTNERQFFVFRDKNSENITKFKEELSRVNWAELPDANDPLLAYNSFLTKYTSIYNVCFLWRAVSDKNTCRISNTSSKYIQLILGNIQLMEKNISLIVKNILLTTKIYNLLGK